MLEELKMLMHNLFCHQAYAVFRFLAYFTRWRWSIKFAILVHESTAPEGVPQWIKDLVPEEFVEVSNI